MRKLANKYWFWGCAYTGADRLPNFPKARDITSACHMEPVGNIGSEYAISLNHDNIESFFEIVKTCFKQYERDYPFVAAPLELNSILERDEF